MSDTLTQFGTSFQAKIIALLMTDVKFVQTISDILQPAMFDSDSNKWLVKSIRDYYYEYKKQPTLEVIKYKIDEIDNDVLKSGVVDKLREVWKNIEATDLEFVQTETLDFCKNQTLKKAILESVDLLENKNYDGMLDDLDLPEGDDSNVASFVASSVPGESLTGDLQDNKKGTLGKYPWETPPEMDSITKAFDFIIKQKDTSSNKTNMIKLMYAGVPAEAIARTITFRGFLEGLWTPDIEELLVIPVIFELVADARDDGVNAKIFNDF